MKKILFLVFVLALSVSTQAAFSLVTASKDSAMYDGMVFDSIACSYRQNVSAGNLLTCAVCSNFNGAPTVSDNIGTGQSWTLAYYMWDPTAAEGLSIFYKINTQASTGTNRTVGARWASNIGYLRMNIEEWAGGGTVTFDALSKDTGRATFTAGTNAVTTYKTLTPTGNGSLLYCAYMGLNVQEPACTPGTDFTLAQVNPTGTAYNLGSEYYVQSTAGAHYGTWTNPVTQAYSVMLVVFKSTPLVTTYDTCFTLASHGAISPTKNADSSNNANHTMTNTASGYTGYSLVVWRSKGKHVIFTDSTSATCTYTFSQNDTIYDSLLALPAVPILGNYNQSFIVGVAVDSTIHPDTVANTGGTVTTWTALPALPAGLGFRSDGVIYGTPSVVTTGDSTADTIVGTNAGGLDSTYVWIKVYPSGTKLFTDTVIVDSLGTYTLYAYAGTGGTVRHASTADSLSHVFKDTADAATKYIFNAWTLRGTGTITSNLAAGTFRLLGNDTADASFTYSYVTPTYTVTIVNDPTHPGTISPISGSGLDSGAMTKFTFTHPAGYYLSGVVASGGAHLNATADSFYLSANGTLTFSDTIGHYLMTNAATNGTFTPASGLQDSGATFTITATPAAHYAFTNWTVTGGAVVTSSTSILTMAYMTGTGTITANFHGIQYTLTMAASGPGTITPVPGAVLLDTAVRQTIHGTPTSAWDTLAHWTGTAGIHFSADSSACSLSTSGTATALFGMRAATVPTQTSPAQGDTLKSKTKVFTWSAQATTDSAFILGLSTDSTTFTFDTVTTNSKSKTLSDSTKYFWKVKGGNPGGWSAYSTVLRFRTAAPASGGFTGWGLFGLMGVGVAAGLGKMFFGQKRRS